MAQRTFYSQLRISVIAEILFIFLCGSICITPLTAAKSQTSNRIDDGGVLVPPALPLRTRQVVAIRNRPLTLHCPIIISEKVRILELWWLKDGSKLDLSPQHQQNPTTTSDLLPPPIPRIWITDDGDLHFEKIIHKIVISRSSFENRHKNYSDEGDYRCVVKSPMGVVVSPVISVTVAALELKEGQEEVKVKAGQPALLECQITSTPQLTSTQVTWHHGNTNLSRLAQESNRFSILSSGTLAISSVQQSDAGIYSCVARHDLLKKERNADVKLVVETPNEVVSSEPPKFLYASDIDSEKTTVILDEEEDHILDCLASGIPLPSITWVLTYEIANATGTFPMYKELSEGKVFYDSIELTAENSMNIISNYTCVAHNDFGHISKTIQVTRLPALLKGPNSYKYPPAKTVRFECRVPPTFTLMWYKDGQLLEMGKGRVKAKNNEIVISNTIRNDSGFYQCEVIADDRVYSVGTARLFVDNNREAPDAPFDLKCIENSSRNLVISWKVSQRENINAFSIHYMPFGGEERQKVVPSRSTNFTIENLRPYTNYSIYIRSYSTKSASAQSSKVVCNTLEDVPAKPPKNFIFERYGPPSQVRMRWRPLSDAEARGKVILYKLQWRAIDGEFTNVRYINGDADEFLITDLTPGQPFELRLLPSTSIGWPLDKENLPWTQVNSTNFDTNSTNLSDYYTAPTMHLTVLNCSSLLVNWSEPPRPKELSVKGYRLTYSTFVRKLDDVVFYGPFFIYDYSVQTHLFTDFAPSTSYEVQLQTFGDTWESAIASKFIGTCGSQGKTVDLPAITGIHVHPISSSEVRLMWDYPKATNSQINYYYTVKYNKAEESNFSSIASTSESVDIRNLEPFTSYEFVVQMTTSEGNVGPYSQKIESRTLPGIPGPPVKLHWRVLNQSLVEVEWQPPPTSNGVIQQYVVQYKPKNESSESQDKPRLVINGTASVAELTDEAWKNKTTNRTSLSIENLLQNKDYVIRVMAETKAGIGDPSDLIYVKIFIRKTPPINSYPQDSPPPTPPGLIDPQSNPQYLGMIIGTVLSIVFVAICATIIIFRHRCFPMLTRTPVGMYVNGNGLAPRAKRSVESFNGVEMKVLIGGTTMTPNDQHLDTKGGHPHANGVIPGPTDPLLMRIVRNPIDHPHGPNDEESVPNCIH